MSFVAPSQTIWDLLLISFSSQQVEQLASLISTPLLFHLLVCSVPFFLSTRMFWLWRHWRGKIPQVLKSILVAFHLTWKIQTAALLETLWQRSFLCSFCLRLWLGNTGEQVWGMSTFSSLLRVRMKPGLDPCLIDNTVSQFSLISPLNCSGHKAQFMTDLSVSIVSMHLCFVFSSFHPYFLSFYELVVCFLLLLHSMRRVRLTLRLELYNIVMLLPLDSLTGLVSEDSHIYWLHSIGVICLSKKGNMSASIYESFFFLYATQPGLQPHINKFEKQILQWDYFYSDLHHMVEIQHIWEHRWYCRHNLFRNN